MSWTDAVNLAIDMYNHDEITLDELDKTATEIWHEMQEESPVR